MTKKSDFSSDNFCHISLCCDTKFAPGYVGPVECGPAGYEVLYVMQGPCRVELFDADGVSVRERHNLFLGDFVCFKSGDYHRLTVISQRHSARVLSFRVSPTRIREFPAQKTFEALLAFDPAIGEFYRLTNGVVKLYDDGRVFDSLYLLVVKYNQSAKRTLLESLFHALVIDVAHLYLGNLKSYKGNLHVKKAVYEIDNNIGNINAGKVANKLNISRAYLQRQFKESLGKSVTDYIMERKINRACRYFQMMPGKTVADIVCHFGCPRVSFERVFKQVTGKTPGEYKNELNNSAFLYRAEAAAAETQQMEDGAEPKPNRESAP